MCPKTPSILKKKIHSIYSITVHVISSNKTLVPAIDDTVQYSSYSTKFPRRFSSVLTIVDNRQSEHGGGRMHGGRGAARVPPRDAPAAPTTSAACSDEHVSWLSKFSNKLFVNLLLNCCEYDQCNCKWFIQWSITGLSRRNLNIRFPTETAIWPPQSIGRHIIARLDQ